MWSDVPRFKPVPMKWMELVEIFLLMTLQLQLMVTSPVKIYLTRMVNWNLMVSRVNVVALLKLEKVPFARVLSMPTAIPNLSGNGEEECEEEEELSTTCRTHKLKNYDSKIEDTL
mmetsp:Transcript_29920/g.49643  ORF Transcript_29920/g.49643 Transcript_29920/m.49643 type:complete len:115 (+) Transcript_29920:990-1334(+)